jgi:hypothetical protein
VGQKYGWRKCVADLREPRLWTVRSACTVGRPLGYMTANIKRIAQRLQPVSLKLKIAGGGPLSRQMERFGPGHQVGQEVTGSMRDNQDSEILRSHPQYAEKETGKRGQHD